MLYTLVKRAIISRFEAHRIGCEDYELLEMLKKIDFDFHKKIIDKIFTNYTTYSTSLKKYKRIKNEY